MDALLALPPVQIRNMILAMIDYVKQDIEPDLEDSLKPLWPMIRQRLDCDMERYQNTRVKNQIKGLISHFRNSYAYQHGLDPRDPLALKEFLRDHGIEEELIQD